jgi:hypothetical protein
MNLITTVDLNRHSLAVSSPSSRQSHVMGARSWSMQRAPRPASAMRRRIPTSSSLPAQLDTAHTAAIKATGAEHGRQLRTIINPMIVCRQTDREAQLYHDSILNAADLGAVEGFVSHQRSGDAVAWKAHGDKHRALGGNIQIIGSPEHVVDKPTCKPDRRWAAPGCSARRSRR